MNKGIIKEILRTYSRILLILIILLLLNIALVMLLNLYLKPKLETLQNDWFTRRKVAGTILDRGSAFEAGTADMVKWRAAIPPRKDLARVVGEIFETARSSSLSIGAITYKPEQIKSEKLLAYVLDLTVTGKYAAVKSFIGDIGRLKDIVAIDAISLNNPKLTEEMVSLKLNVTIYLQLEGQ